MRMFCYQCQETNHNNGCLIRGICGKDARTAALQNYLLYALKGLALYSVPARKHGITDPTTDLFVAQALFATLTNVNFDSEQIYQLSCEAFARRNTFREQLEQVGVTLNALPAMATCDDIGTIDDYARHGEILTLHTIPPHLEDIHSLRELLIYGLKGLAAYCDHAFILNRSDPDLLAFLQEGLAITTDNTIGVADLLTQVMRCGQYGVQAMALLDQANTTRFGHPEPTTVHLGVDPSAPGILVSGHDLLDLYEVLEQTAGTGINVYTHGEMLPAHAYPAFKQFPHLIGNYGGAWWEQQQQFKHFNGPILMTTNCIQKPHAAYADRIFTTGMVGWEGLPHIADRQPGQAKDFGPLIARASSCKAPTELENGSVQIGFAHHTMEQIADEVLMAIQSGAIKHFVVMAGCDGKHKERAYYTGVAQKLPEDTIILTAGCAKYRYNKLGLGTINGLPRVWDAGQCNDSYSLVIIAQKLAQAVGAAHINDLPISYDIAWYEQKAVLVLLSLLSLGVKGIRLGPTLPAFLSPNITDFLIRTFDLKTIKTVEVDVAEMSAVV